MRILYNSVILVILKFCVLFISETQELTFTKVPPDVLYVTSGKTARLEWDYSVSEADRNANFGSYSPTWYYYQNTTRIQIAFEYKYSNPKWKWKVAPSCPDTLKDRLSKESTATLVISDVTIADSGEYECQLYKIKPTAKTESSKTRLIITVHPTFLPSHPNKTYQIIEGQDLKINCTAIGPPTPNITWVNTTDGSVIMMTQGSGSAVLRVDNILRYHAGVYECWAKNNPHESLTTTRTNVTVYYPPFINKTATLDAFGCIGGKVELFCIAGGEPKPSIKWQYPDGSWSPKLDKGELSISVKNISQFGNYTCCADNDLGNDTYVVSLTETTCPPPTPKPASDSVPAGIIAGVAIAGVLAIAGLIIALVFCYRRKSSQAGSRRNRVREERSVQMSSLPDEGEQYASVQHQQNQVSTNEPSPQQYAQVDKAKKTKKKNNPDEVFYADLGFDSRDDLGSRPSSGRQPTGETTTLYADITGTRQQQLEPQYGNLPGSDIDV